MEGWGEKGKSLALQMEICRENLDMWLSSHFGSKYPALFGETEKSPVGEAALSPVCFSRPIPVLGKGISHYQKKGGGQLLKP